jgi:antitoxin VapB
MATAPSGEHVAQSKTFKHGGSHAVRIPKALRLPEGEVVVRRHGRGVLIEPVPGSRPRTIAEMWRTLETVLGPEFMAEGRDRPAPWERHFGGW